MFTVIFQPCFFVGRNCDSGENCDRLLTPRSPPSINSFIQSSEIVAFVLCFYFFTPRTCFCLRFLKASRHADQLTFRLCRKSELKHASAWVRVGKCHVCRYIRLYHNHQGLSRALPHYQAVQEHVLTRLIMPCKVSPEPGKMKLSTKTQCTLRKKKFPKASLYR